MIEKGNKKEKNKIKEWQALTVKWKLIICKKMHTQ